MSKKDSNGKNFEFPTCILDKVEYAKIISEINTNYEAYKDKRYAVHYTTGVDKNYYLYYFENRGYNDYNIVKKIQFLGVNI